MKKRVVWAMLTLSLMSIVSTVPATFAQSDLAKVRIVHASPDAPAMDVYIDKDQTPMFTNLPFFTASKYLDIQPGTHNFQITPADVMAGRPVTTLTSTIEAGKAYTFAIIGKVANIQLKQLNDDLTDPDARSAKVRAVQLSPDTSAVDVNFKDGTPLASDLAFRNANAYQQVRAGTYSFFATPVNNDAATVERANTNLAAGRIYDLFVIGLQNGEPALRIEVGTYPVVPAMLPNTGDETMPVVWFGFVAVLLMIGGLVMRRWAT